MEAHTKDKSPSSKDSNKVCECGLLSNNVLVEAAKHIFLKRIRVLHFWMKDKDKEQMTVEDERKKIDQLWQEMPVNQKHIYFAQVGTHNKN
jgi:hypothetical protein